MELIFIVWTTKLDSEFLLHTRNTETLKEEEEEEEEEDRHMSPVHRQTDRQTLRISSVQMIM